MVHPLHVVPDLSVATWCSRSLLLHHFDNLPLTKLQQDACGTPWFHGGRDIGTLSPASSAAPSSQSPSCEPHQPRPIGNHPRWEIPRPGGPRRGMFAGTKRQSEVGHGDFGCRVTEGVVHGDILGVSYGIVFVNNYVRFQHPHVSWDTIFHVDFFPFLLAFFIFLSRQQIKVFYLYTTTLDVSDAFFGRTEQSMLRKFFFYPGHKFYNLTV